MSASKSKVNRSSQQPRSLARQRKRPAVAKATSDTLNSVESKVRGVRGQPPSATRSRSLSIPVYSLTGRSAGIMALPKEVFGQKVNKNLLAQAVRVYETNQKGHFGSTKTRGEVRGSTAKIYRQKGTGRARHGAIRAPIFVGGGITFGPKPRKVRLTLPQRMKKAALISALSSKMADKEILGLSGLEKATGKTKEMAKLTKNLKLKTALIVTEKPLNNIVRAVRNIPGFLSLPVNQLNAYEILKYQTLILTKEALEGLKK